MDAIFMNFMNFYELENNSSPILLINIKLLLYNSLSV